ncbi:MFS transporter [Pseudochelatococcus contaminans]|uniref:MFS family permease n=1 Tax=Pseudochelatococcus contaminans TaxID=1538103 RepID=A0A7W5Z4N5_9HYPH|nr:MFS transporter [Pseudochelatococcus contaminans]MBB3810116.1 MFS family permease [Pseudochelatococcus contaminans]
MTMPDPQQQPSPARVRPAIPTTVWALGFVSLLMDVSSEMIQTLLPLYLSAGLGVSVLAIGFIEGLSVAIATATKFFSGVLADISQRNKPLAVLGYGLGALSRLIFPIAGTVDLVVMAKAMDRVGKGIRGTPRDALIAAVSPPDIRGASFGLRKSLDTVGGFLGPLVAIAVMMLMAGDIVAVFWIAAIPAALAIVVLLVFVHEPKTAQPANRPRFHLSQSLKLNRAVWAVIGIAALIMLARFSEAFVLLKSLDAGFTPTWVPLSMVIMHVAYGLTAYPVGRLSDRVGRDGLLICSLVFLIVAHLTLAFADNVALYIAGTVLWGLHMGFSQGLLGAMIADTTPNALKGSAFGTFNLVTGVVVLAGNTAAGWFWESYGSAMPFLIGATISAVAIVLLCIKMLRAARSV